MKNTRIKTKKTKRKSNLEKKTRQKEENFKKPRLISSESQKICKHETRTEQHKKGIFKSRHRGALEN